MGGSIHSILPDDEVNWVFSAHLGKDGTDNHSRRTDCVMRSANLPTAPFFRELRAEKERSKETQMKSTSLLLTVS